MQIIHLLWIIYIQTSSASAYCSFLHFLLIYLCSWLAINPNEHLRNATRMVSEFPRAIHWSPELFPIPSLYYLCRGGPTTVRLSFLKQRSLVKKIPSLCRFSKKLKKIMTVTKYVSTLILAGCCNVRYKFYTRHFS